MTDWIVDLDRTLFVLMNGELTHPVLDRVMPVVTTQENWYPVLLGLWVALLIWGGRRGRAAAAMLVVAIAFSDQVSCAIVKPLVSRVRPCTALPPGEIRLLVGASKAFSFPSAHAANSFAMATVVTWRFRKLAPLFFAIATLVAYSRVYVGVHYPLDVIGGAILGIALGRLAILIVVLLYRWWARIRAARAG